jgi:hypothetical protein
MTMETRLDRALAFYRDLLAEAGAGGAPHPT